MKKIGLLFGILILMQGCYSYKSVEINPKTMVIGQLYKIERNHKTTKVTYTSNADSAIVVTLHGVNEQIPLKEITKVRQGKFSLGKTIALFPVVLIGLSVALIYGSGG